MKPGGAFEVRVYHQPISCDAEILVRQMIEEDLFFPGKRPDDQEELSFERRDDASSITRRDSTSSEHYNVKMNGSAPTSPTTPTTVNTILPSSSPTQTISSTEHGHRSERRTSEEQPILKPSTQANQVYRSSPPRAVMILPHGRSSARPKLHVKTPGQSTIMGSSTSLLGSMGYVVSIDTLNENMRGRSGSTGQSPGSSGLPSPGGIPIQVPKAPASLSTPSPAPNNPRDHAILDAIWNGMLEGRFVNGSPLSILTSYLEWHFKGS